MSDAADARIPPAVAPLLAEYRARLGSDLPGLVAALYLHGSIACGAFVAGASDVDALVLLTRECDAAELARLRKLHADLAARWPALKLEASYVQWADRGRLGPGVPPHPYHHDGVFHERGVFDFNSPRWASILWWQVRRHGIALGGPPREALGFDVSAERIVVDSRRLVETFWADWTRRRAQLTGLRHPAHVDWVVLGMLRTWYTLCEHDVTSKPGAAAYGLAHLPRRWHPLIRETLALRGQPARQGPLRRLRRAVQAALFMRFMVGECRRLTRGK